MKGIKRIGRLILSLLVAALTLVVAAPSASRAYAAVDNWPYQPTNVSKVPTVTVDPYGTVKVTGTIVGPTDSNNPVSGWLLLGGSTEVAAGTSQPQMAGTPYTIVDDSGLRPGVATEVKVAMRLDDNNYAYGDWKSLTMVVYDQMVTPPALSPTAPTFNDTTGKVYIPSQLDVTYTVNGVVKPSGWYSETGTVNVVASSNYVQVKDNTWSHTFGSPIVPTKPQQQVLPGPNNDIIVIPTMSGVTYACTGWTKGVDVCKATVTATGATTSWTYHDTNTPYPLVKHPVYCNTQSGRLQQGAAVGNPNVILVGNILTLGGKWNEKLAVKEFGTLCASKVTPPPVTLIKVTAVNGTFSDKCGSAFNATFNAPDTTGVEYVDTRQGNTLTVKAQVTDASKYVLTNPQWSQSYTDKLVACPVDTKPPANTGGNGGHKGGTTGNGGSVPVSTPLPPHSGAEGIGISPVGLSLEVIGGLLLLGGVVTAVRKKNYAS